MTRPNPIETKKFKANEVLFFEGENSRQFYLIKNGKVGVYKHNDEGGAVPLAVVGPGESLGELAMIDNSPRSAMAITLTEVEAIVVSEAGCDELFDEIPEWSKSVLRLLVRRLRKMNNVLVKHGIYDTEIESEIETAKKDAEENFSEIILRELSKRQK